MRVCKGIKRVLRRKTAPLIKQSAFIVHIDIVGSTEFVRKDMILAHERIQSLYTRIRHVTKTCSGYVHELRGDAAVLGFEKADNAVVATLILQQSNTLLNSTRLGLIEPRMRIGICKGNVVIGDNTITGEPVIIAQRLEQLARPSQVLIDQKVRRELSNNGNYKIKFCKTEILKGFVEPTKIFAVTADPERIFRFTVKTEALQELHRFADNWDHKYPQIGKSWRAHWPNLVTLFDYPDEFRKAIYTTNAIESLNSVIRKSIKKTHIIS